MPQTYLKVNLIWPFCILIWPFCISLYKHFTLLFGLFEFVSISYLESVKRSMEPFDTKIISIIKKNLKEIGELTLPLCRNDDSHTEDVARDINKLAHDTYELIWLAENSIKKEIDMKTLKEKGVPTLKL